MPPLLAEEPSAEISDGVWSVRVNDAGVLVGVPDGGLITTDGPQAVLAERGAEWFGVSYETDSGVTQCVGLGENPDWGHRLEVQRVSFDATPESVVAVTQAGDLRIETRLFFAHGALTASVVLSNTGSVPLRNLLYSREWRQPGQVGWTFPDDLAPPSTPPADVRRMLWMPTDLPAGERIRGIGFSYRPAGQATGGGVGPAAVDVPLELYTDLNWPNGLAIGDTSGVSFGDYNGDGWIDFFACESAELWENVGGMSWFLAADLTSIIPPAQLRYGSSFGDYNHDGLPDIGTEPRRGGDSLFHLLRNQTITAPDFVDVGGDSNIIDVQPSGDAETLCWADVDGDGDIDAFLPVYKFNGNPGNWFLRNNGPVGGVYTFTEMVDAAGLDNPRINLRPEGAEFCDQDGDGDLDLYSNGTLYQNISKPGIPNFRDQTELANDIGFRADYDEGAAFLDYDMDGDQDLIVAYCDGGHGVRIWENEGDGTYFLADQEIIDSWNTGLCLGFSKCDWDLDGDVDITTRQVFRRNQRVETDQRKFTVATHNIPSTHLTSATPAWGDSDRDGDPDCCLGNWRDVGHYYENVLHDDVESASDRRHLRVKPVRDSDIVPHGLETEFGATVEIVLRNVDDDLRRQQFVSSAGGYLNQNEYALTFGLPADPTPDDAGDVRFDVVVDFPMAQSQGLWRVDKDVNPVLGNLDLADLHGDREIVVFRSGKVVIDQCSFTPPKDVSPALVTTTKGLDLSTRNVGLSPPTPAPNTNWFVGIELDTFNATEPLLVKELIVDGLLESAPAACGGVPHVLAFWDVTDPANPFLVASFDETSSDRNHRSRFRTPVPLAPQRVFRVVAAVTELRPSTKNLPSTQGPVTTTGGLSFQDLDPCSGLNVVGAIADLSHVYLAVRVSETPPSPWLDLGQGLGGASGEPVLGGTGSVTPGSSVTVTLDNATPLTQAALVVGTSIDCQSIFGGVLVPAPDVILFFPTDGAGSWAMSGTWPNDLPGGFTTLFQAFVPDVTAPEGVALSNALSATQPY